MFKVLAQQTGEAVEVCNNVIVAYESYCTEEIKRPFKKEVDQEMVNWISAATYYGEERVRELLTQLVILVRNEVKRKIPFIK